MSKSFTTTLFRIPGPGGWTFARIPDEHAPPVTEGWGRTPVLASVDGREWETSVWRDKRHGTLLPVPAEMRRGKGDGDAVVVILCPSKTRATSAPTPARRTGGKAAARPARSSARSARTRA